MPSLFRRNKSSDIAKQVADELLKAGLAGSPMAASGATVAVTPPMVQALQTGPGQQVNPLFRERDTFGGQLGPAYPFLPTALDPVDETTGRATPRRYEYRPALNLDLTQNTQAWSLLRTMAEQCDIVNRCINIRIGQLVGQDWAWTLSDQVVKSIMAEQNVSYAKAMRIGRETYAADIDRMQRFWDNPYPNSDRGFAEWLTELLWQHFPFDGVAVYPRWTYGGDCLGFEIIDSPTIKVLLDNRGDTPQPPAPAYQQILWGFPRGEFQASRHSDGEFYANDGDGVFKTDQLAYFVRNRRTWSPYGFSSVEAALPAATLYLERQRWMRSEYVDGSMPQTFMKSDSDEMDPQRLTAMERILNDRLAGNTTERHRIKMLPKGLDPVFAPNMDERYRSDYDEYLMKRVAVHFGVQPTDLGMIPRSGLGGKGQQEGEQDSADKFNSRPLEAWLVDVINALSRRFLGIGRELTFVFTGNENADNDATRIEAFQKAVFAGFKTENDVRGELGLPLYDTPEADMPFVMTASGMQFLSGSYIDERTDTVYGEEPVHLRQPEAQSEATQESQASQSSDATQSLNAAKESYVEVSEAKTFAAYIKRRNKSGRWRAFEFQDTTPAAAEALNDAAYWLVKGLDDMPDDWDAWMHNVLVTAGLRSGDNPLVKRAEPASERWRKRLEAYYAPRILKALSQVSGIEAAARQAAEEGQQTDKAGRSDRGRAIARNHIRIDSRDMTKELKRLYQDAYLAGRHVTVDTVGQGAVLSTSLRDVVGGINWSSWRPGSELASRQIRDGGLKAMLDRADITIRGINDTTMNRIGDLIGEGLSAGSTWQDIARSLDDYVGDGYRADNIATTETGRAFIQSTLDGYGEAGYSQFDWVAYGDEALCEDCADMEASNPHDLSDDTPPLHPDCRCYIDAVLDSQSDNAEIDSEE